MAGNMWRQNTLLANALEASTSRDYVLPSLESSFIESKEIMENFLKLERYHMIKNDIFSVQSEVTPAMRNLLLEWMLEVCEEEQCSCEIFPMAASYVDRFLSVEAVHKNQLQALGTSCLFIASKAKMVSPINAHRLVDYTDDAVSVSQLLSWELLVLNRLNWDVSTLTAFDFLDQYLHRLHLSQVLIARLQPLLKYLIPLCIIDFPMATTLEPSIIAASCLQVALMNVNVVGGLDFVKNVTICLKKITGIEMDQLDMHVKRVQELYAERQQNPNKSFTCSEDDISPLNESKIESSDSINGASSTTPRDIEDVVIF